MPPLLKNIILKTRKSFNYNLEHMHKTLPKSKILQKFNEYIQLVPVHFTVCSNGQTMAIPTSNLFDLQALESLDGLRYEQVAGVPVP